MQKHGYNTLYVMSFFIYLAFDAVFINTAVLADAPHDIQINQRLWLDGLDVNGSDVGNGGGTNPVATVSTWQDKSPNSFLAGEAFSLSASNRTLPTYSANQGVSFDGNWDVLEIPSGIYGDGTSVSQSDFYLVATTRRQINSFAFAQNPTFNSGNRISAHLPWGNGTIFWDHVCCGTGRLTANWPSNASVFGQSYLWNLRANAGVSQLIWRDGNTLASKGTSATYTEQNIDNFYIGGAENGSGNNHDGIISELIVYRRELISAERRILLSYLNAKHQIPGGIGSENRYTNSASFNFHVGGIGQENTGALSTGTSAGLTLSNNSWLANGRYLIAGLQSLNPVSGTTNSEIPLSSALRAERIWYLDNSSGGAGNVNLTFDFAKIGVTPKIGDNWQLVFRNGTSGDFSVLQSENYAGGGSITFIQNNPQDGYYTIARTKQVDFNVSKISSVLSDGISVSNPKAIPDSEIEYRINIVNNQDSPDDGSFKLSDVLPSEVDLFVGDFANGAPYDFIDSIPGCDFTLPFTSLASTNDAIEFRDAIGTIITPTPDLDGFDTNVREIILSPSGVLAPFSGTGPEPSCTIIFKVRIKETP